MSKHRIRISVHVILISVVLIKNACNEGDYSNITFSKGVTIQDNRARSIELDLELFDSLMFVG